MPPLALKIDNQIPIGKGCGSSAAARLAGIALAVHFGKLRWTDSRIVGEASRREHHPDNAAACWMGGLAVARMSGESEAQVASVIPKGKWPLLLAVPDEALPTEEARRVLPAQYSRADAVTNVQNSMLLLAAFVQGRRDLLASALDDRMHQPYRAALCPLLPALQKLAADTPGILGAVLSGAGPSVLIFLDDKVGAERAQAKVRSYLQAQRTQSGTGPNCNYQSRSRPGQSLDSTTRLTAAPLFSFLHPAVGREAEEMLFKTQMRFASEAIRIRIQCSLEVLNLSPRLALEGSAR